MENPIKMGTPIVGNLHLHILDRGKSNKKPSPNYMDGLSLGLPQQNSCWMEIKISALTNEPWQIAASHFMISCINQSAVVSLLAQNRLVLDSKMPASKANLHAGQGMVRVICKGKNSKHTKTCIWKLLHFPRVYGCWTLHIYLSLLKEII